MRKIIIFLFLIFISGCFVSLDATYVNDREFEHCVYLDRDQYSNSWARLYCWRRWMAYYTYGEPDFKINYCSVRIRELELYGR